MLLSTLRAMTLQALREAIMQRMAQRRRIGPFDWSPGSHDDQTATARAYRVMCRVNGRRITMREAMWS